MPSAFSMGEGVITLRAAGEKLLGDVRRAHAQVQGAINTTMRFRIPIQGGPVTNISGIIGAGGQFQPTRFSQSGVNLGGGATGFIGGTFAGGGGDGSGPGRRGRHRKSLGSFGVNRQNILTQLGITAGGISIGNLFKNAAKEALSFENEIAGLSTLLDQNASEAMETFGGAISDMSKEFGQGADDLARSQRMIVSAMIPVNDSMELLEIATKAAVGGLTNTKTATSGLINVLNSYGKEVSEAAEVSDIMFQTVKRGKLFFEDLSKGIGRVAAPAALAGLNFNELSAAISTVTRAGIPAAEAFSSLNTLMLTFLKPQQNAIEAAEKYGIELSSTALKAEGLISVLRKLRFADPKDIALIAGRIRGLRALAALTQDFEGFTQDLIENSNAAGSAAAAFDKMRETAVFAAKQARQEWAAFKRELGTIFDSDFFKNIGDAAAAIAGLRRQFDAFFSGTPLNTSDRDDRFRGFTNKGATLETTFSSTLSGATAAAGSLPAGSFQKFQRGQLKDQQQKAEANELRKFVFAPPGLSPEDEKIIRKEFLEKHKRAGIFSPFRNDLLRTVVRKVGTFSGEGATADIGEEIDKSILAPLLVSKDVFTELKTQLKRAKELKAAAEEAKVGRGDEPPGFSFAIQQRQELLFRSVGDKKADENLKEEIEKLFPNLAQPASLLEIPAQEKERLRKLDVIEDTNEFIKASRNDLSAEDELQRIKLQNKFEGAELQKQLILQEVAIRTSALKAEFKLRFELADNEGDKLLGKEIDRRQKLIDQFGEARFKGVEADELKRIGSPFTSGVSSRLSNFQITGLNRLPGFVVDNPLNEIKRINERMRQHLENIDRRGGVFR